MDYDGKRCAACWWDGWKPGWKMWLQRGDNKWLHCKILVRQMHLGVLRHIWNPQFNRYSEYFYCTLIILIESQSNLISLWEISVALHSVINISKDAISMHASEKERIKFGRWRWWWHHRYQIIKDMFASWLPYIQHTHKQTHQECVGTVYLA